MNEKNRVNPQPVESTSRPRFELGADRRHAPKSVFILSLFVITAQSYVSTNISTSQNKCPVRRQFPLRHTTWRTDRCSGNALDLYSGGTFEPRSVRRFFLLRFSYFSSVTPAKFRDSISIRQEPLLPNPFQFIIHLSSYHPNVM
jgi:hypothetical protein